MDIRYITTPIYYVNGDPHIGHAHTSVMGDIIKRINLMKGRKTVFSTGTDEHGQKNQEAIEKSGLSAEQYLTRQSDRFRSLFERLDVGFDIFMRTTTPQHIGVVSRILDDLYHKKLIYKKDYSGLYCLGCEQFKKVSDLDERGRCPDHLTVPTEQTETNYFLKMSPFQDWLISWIQTSESLIQPDFYRKEILAMLEEPLEDLCISRPKNRVWLGIELPFDPQFVTYVWFDALLNYISNLRYGDNSEFQEIWDHSMHLMAKDIIKTHIIYWPIMLKAAGITPPAFYRIHGYWIAEGGQKMSKSLGNYVEPGDLLDMIGTDGLRYFMAKSMGGSDAQISQAMVVSCYNTDLANNIGNLLSRVVKFAVKKYDQSVPCPESIFPEDSQLQTFVGQRLAYEMERFDLVTLPETVRTLLDIANRLNLHYNDAAPWQLAKDPGRKNRLDSIMYVMLDCLRLLFEALYPIMPASSNQALRCLGQDGIPGKAVVHEFKAGKLIPGHLLSDPGMLFPRIET